jgi:uncharacterized membrane protein
VTEAPSGIAGRLRANIDLIERRRREEAEQAPWSTRISLRIGCLAGSMRFVVAHALVFGAWALVNAGLVPGIKPFDPSFVVLGTTASVEAIFLSTFVLISQNRLAEASERRADLDLHINLLAEHELTRLAVLVERIAARLDVPADDPDFVEVKKDVEPGEVLETLDKTRASG